MMSLRYKISPELNMILYVGKGSASPSEFFALEEAAFRNHPRQRGMITLVDALELSTCFDLNDIHRFIGNIDTMTKNGMEPGAYFMLTKDRGLHLLAEAAKLIAGQLDLKARMFYTLQEAIVALGVSEREEEIIQLWNECKLESSKTGGEIAKVTTLGQAAQN